MNPSEQEIALLFKALGDENRIRILKLLRCGGKCACKLLEELNISQPTLSHHMRILCDSGIVKSRREGKWMHYTICTEEVQKIRSLMQGLLFPENSPTDCGYRKE